MAFVADKICAVCGDKAYGNNFGALSCESCRSFFRRNAVKQFKCFYGQKCRIDYMGRKFCKKCRIDKCLEVGMKKELIRNYERNKIQSKIIPNLNPKESEMSSMSESTSDSLEENIVIKYKCLDSKKEDLKNTFEIPVLIRGLIFDFSQFEFSRLKVLFGATANLREPVMRAYEETTNFDQILKVMHKRCEIKCNRIVKMSTQIQEFSDLCEDDKIELLKAATPLIILLISIINFDFDGHFWTITTDENFATRISLDVFKYVSHILYETQKQFLYYLRSEMDDDINLLDLLSAIILFNPNLLNLSQRDKVKSEGHTFEHLLQRYLELKFQSKIVAQNRFIGLMNCLQQLYALNRIHDFTYVKQNHFLEESNPLVKELYDVS